MDEAHPLRYGPDLTEIIPIAVPEVADGPITISGGVVALGIGYEWARGTLVYQGRAYPFWVHSIRY
jgi:hypothetical protein